jgi:hypothetical protein
MTATRAPLTIAIVLAGIAGAALFTAHTYGRGSGLLPIFVGRIFLGLVLIELVLQTKAFFTHGRRSTSTATSAAACTALPAFRGVGWLGLLLIAVYLVGFLLATPAYIFAFLRVSGHKSLYQCFGLSGLTTAFIYILFVELLDYELYPGILFGG